MRIADAIIGLAAIALIPIAIAAYYLPGGPRITSGELIIIMFQVTTLLCILKKY